MPESTATQAARKCRYTIWVNGREVKGPAEQVLARILREAKPDSSLRDLAVDEYANTLIENATLFFPNGRVPELLASHEFPSDFDKALSYLDAMPSSGIRILSRN